MRCGYLLFYASAGPGDRLHRELHFVHVRPRFCHSVHKSIKFLFCMCDILHGLHMRKDIDDCGTDHDRLETCRQVLHRGVDKNNSSVLWSNIDIIVVHRDLAGVAEEECGLNVEALGNEFAEYGVRHA